MQEKLEIEDSSGKMNKHFRAVCSEATVKPTQFFKNIPTVHMVLYFYFESRLSYNF